MKDMPDSINSIKREENSSEQNLKAFIDEASTNNSKILISACLLGKNVKYNGGNNAHEKLIELFEKNPSLFIPVCPETQGGLPIPRPPAEIQPAPKSIHESKTKITNNLGEDVSHQFLKGAELTLKTALKHGATYAILKESSPSCGANLIYDGNFNGIKIPGEGITTRLLRQNGIKVHAE